MSNTSRPVDRKISSSASLFKKVLQAFANGDLPYSDVESHLQRLLGSGASAEELREVLQRYESIEPLPAYAHVEILRILNEAMARTAAANVDSDPARSQPSDGQSATASIPVAVPDARPSERSPEPIAAAVEARVLSSATVSAVTAVPRPVTARASAVGVEATASTAENVSSIEDRIARQKADYKALNHAYERVRDAGSAASARTIALAAELAALRGALELEQGRTREFEKALAESAASGETARERSDEARRELQRAQADLRSARDLLAARDTAIGQLRLSIGEREDQLAALQADQAQRMAAIDAGASVGARLQADLQAERARSTVLRAELAGIRTALESAQVTIREADEAWAEKLASAEAARLASAESARREAEAVRKEAEAARKKAEAAHKEEVRRESERHQVELGTVRDSLAKLRAQLEADLQASRVRATALAAELASTQAALELEHSKTRETRKALAERVEAEEAAQSQGEDALWKLEGYRAELSKARDLLATRQQEHTRIVAALEARANDLEARLQAAETRVDVNQFESKASHEITVALDPPRERAPSARIDVQEYAPAATTARIDVQEYAPAATTVRIDTRETAPPAALKSKRAAQFSEFPPFGSRGRGLAAAVARFALIGGALAVLAAVIWVFNRHAPPVAENVSAVVSAAAPKPGSVIRDCPTCPALTIVPAGRFKQGSNHTDGNTAAFERPPHWVLIGGPFAISTNAVTVDEFRPFIAATGRDMRGCDTYEDRWRIRPDASWESPGFVQTGSHPVTCVSWDDAKAYAGWLSRTTGHRYRLPSAAEWEYAARAGGEAVRPWNPDGSGACASANVADQRAARRYPGWTAFPCDDGYVFTAPVGSFKANSFGLNDMLGNVFQWTDDCWHADYTGVPTDGSSRTYGDCTERELRGGSWFTAPDFVRASYRNHFGVNYRASSVGIRLVRDIAP
jgi:formylglycine-generating enzyme required for sulfatase activity